MSTQRRAQIVDCTECGSTVVGYQSGDPCPNCGEVVLGA